MFHLHQQMSYWLYPHATDMRKGFYTLAGIVSHAMGRDVREGEVFIFLNRPRTSMKILHMECNGLVIYHIRLEQGCFSLPDYDPQSHCYHTSWQELMLMAGQNKTEVKIKKNRG